MSMRYLIDGYNLMHVLGMVPRGSPITFARARERFIEWLGREAARENADLLLVFDSKQGKSKVASTRHAIQVVFSAGKTADDVIEEILAAEGRSRSLTLVSNDNRLRLAAKHRGCTVWSCEQFIDWLAEPPAAVPPQLPEHPADKPPETTAAEVAEWLARFENR